jgi:hypothetical protein
MNRTDMVPSPTDAMFMVTTAFADGVVTARLMGEAGIQAHGALASLLVDVHASAVDQGADRVDIDFRMLEFMNSTCFKELVRWLAQLESAPGGYRVRLLGTSDTHWQRRSLDALKCFAPALVAIEL